MENTTHTTAGRASIVATAVAAALLAPFAVSTSNAADSAPPPSVTSPQTNALGVSPSCPCYHLI